MDLAQLANFGERFREFVDDGLLHAKPESTSWWTSAGRPETR